MDERLQSLASQIRDNYSSISAKAGEARARDPSLVVSSRKVPLDMTVAAVDGGLLSQRMHGTDIVLVRTVGVRFVYSGSRLSSHSYFPSRSPEPELEMRDSLDEHEALVFRSLIRLNRELRCALSMLEEKTGALLIDGSLLPLPSDRPGADSPLSGLYHETLSLYSSLHSRSSEGGCLLLGVIKDTRSKKLSKSLDAGCSDSIFCDYLLSEGQRTRDFPYSEEKTTSDFPALAQKVRVFYIKPSASDLPLRIETLDSAGGIERAASVVHSLCAISEHFAYPAALIEADMRAALDSAHLDSVESSLIRLSGMRPLRRNSRPFR